ncbi:MAG: alanine--glyoxylate aminotransferase family protein, partial [Sulfurimonas sp.]|nr:alanine--glyoxylate aminotransferase family protein [Sulfurimonas sp.]
MLLFTPGPTPVPQNVRNAMSDETMHHRTPEFEAIFEKTRKHLFNLLKSDEVVMIAS